MTLTRGAWVALTAAAIVLPAVPVAAQIPNPVPALNAARGAKAATEAAQQKNADALDPSQRPTSAGQTAPASPPPAAPQPPSGMSSQPAAGMSSQVPAGTPSQPPSGAPSQPGQSAEPEPAPGYTYDPHGRRDPFISLLTGGGNVTPNGPKPPGLGGTSVNDLTVKGVLKSTKGAFIALLQSPDNKTYIVHAGDKVFDGSVKAISQDAVVFLQDVNDPLSLVKQREVRKTVRPEAR